MDYIIHIYFGLCNPKANHTSEKKKTYGLHNPEVNLMYRKYFQIM